MTKLVDFYSGKTVLVTGHTGFKGCWLTTWLNQMGANVVGYSLAGEESFLFEAANVASQARHIEGDVRDAAAVESVFERHQPEIVLHLAAQALVRRSYHEPLHTISTNVVGTANVLDAAHRCRSVRAVVNVTTDKCYQNQERAAGYREDDRLGGFDPYSASKACSELVTDAFRNSYYVDKHLGIASARAGNVIGGGDFAADRLIPDFVRAISAGEAIQLRYPEAVRPWQFVLEPLCGYLTLAQRLCDDPSAFSGAWNFGPREDAHITVLEVASKLVDAWGEGQVRTPPASNVPPHETTHLALDCTKAQTELSWRPILSVDEALGMTTAWYKQVHEETITAEAITRGQIQNYMQWLEFQSQVSGPEQKEAA